MTQKYIKTPIPEEISDKGGATIQFVERQTVPLETSVREAIDGLYVLGQEALVRANFFGLMRSASDGIRRDGHARQIGDYLTIYPVVTGEIDLERGWNPAVNGVRIIARLLNELELDITKWSFEDVTPGKQSFKLNTVSTLGVEGIAEVGKIIAINGSGLPKTDAIRVDWAVEGTDKSGTIPATKVTSNDVRANLAADALSELASDEYDGKTIVFTVRGNFSNAKISAKLKYVVRPEPIYESDLGGIRVFAAKDSQGDALPDDELNVPGTDDQLVLEGEGLMLTDPDNPTTGIGKAYFKASDSAETCESSLTPLGDGKLALSLGMDSAALEDGSYPDAKYIFFAYKDGESDSLEIPFALHKGE